MISSLNAIRDWCVGASRCSSTFLGMEKCFLVRKLYQETGGVYVDYQIWHDGGFLGNLDRPVRPPINRSDRSRQVCKIANWTAPLRRSRRDDRNPYIECPIWSPDEGVIPPERPAPRSDRSRDLSDRSEMPNLS